MRFTRVLPLALSLSIVVGANAQQSDSTKQAGPTPPVPAPKSFVSQHEATFNGESLRYTATAGEVHLTNDAGEPVASIWSTAYTKNDAEPNRPVTFVFNGGPGSASVWLHMGLFGPRRIEISSEADEDDGAAPYPIINNPHAPLDVTDIVFVDPVGTGYSRAVGKGKGTDFWGLSADAESSAQFVRLWITTNKRWNSPRYLAGESFGTTRAAAVADVLAGNGQDVALNGLILISQALDYTGSTPAHDNLIAYVTYLPTIAATARYHGKAGVGQSVEDFVQAAREFAFDEYAPALFKGSGLSDGDRDHIAERLAYFTGLDKDYVLRADLRVLAGRFLKELLRDQGLSLGRLDGRYARDDIDDTAEDPESDGAMEAISSAYTAGLNHYLATELNVVMDRPYMTSNREIGRNWIWKPASASRSWEPIYVNVSRGLANAMRRNSDLRVMVANGYYDFATPFFDAEYTFGRHGIVKERVFMKYYEAGHMMYIREADLVQLSADIREFVAQR
jgi:carboxypeptidase C (cathepsin A)